MDSATNPKDQQTIRKALESIRSEANVTAPAGPHAEGMSPHHPVLIATFHSPNAARQFQKILIDGQIDPDIANEGGSTQVTVDAEDAKRATKLYFDHKEILSDGKALRNPRRHDLLILCTVIGLTLGVIIAVVLPNMMPHRSSFNDNNMVYYGDRKSIRADDLVVWLRAAKVATLTFALIVITGHLGDRFRMKKLKDARLRRAVDLWEFLWLFAMPVIAYALFCAVADLLPLLRFT